MANTRFGLGSDNKTLKAAAKIINFAPAGYTNPPANSQDAQYPTPNLQVQDRFSPHRTADALTGTFNLDWDLGAQELVSIATVHAFRLAAGAVAPTLVSIQYQVSAYNGTGTWINFSTNPVTIGRDCGSVVEPAINARYWRFSFAAVTGGFSVGNYFLGPISVDMGKAYSGGAEHGRNATRLDARRMDGSVTSHYLGFPVWSLRFPFLSVTTADRDKLVTVGSHEQPVTLVTPSGAIFQVRPEVQQMSRHVYGPADTWDVVLGMESYA